VTILLISQVAEKSKKINTFEQQNSTSNACNCYSFVIFEMSKKHH